MLLSPRGPHYVVAISASSNTQGPGVILAHTSSATHDEMFFSTGTLSFLHSAGLPFIRRPAKLTEIDLLKAPRLLRPTAQVTFSASYRAHVLVHSETVRVDPVVLPSAGKVIPRPRKVWDKISAV